MDNLEKIMLDERFNCLSQRMGTVEKNVSEMSVNIRTIMEKPARRWDSIIEKTRLVAAGAVVTWLLAASAVDVTALIQGAGESWIAQLKKE